MTTLLQSETILKELHEIYILAIEKKTIYGGFENTRAAGTGSRTFLA